MEAKAETCGVPQLFNFEPPRWVPARKGEACAWHAGLRCLNSFRGCPQCRDGQDGSDAECLMSGWLHWTGLGSHVFRRFPQALKVEAAFSSMHLPALCPCRLPSSCRVSCCRHEGDWRIGFRRATQHELGASPNPVGLIWVST